MPVLAGAHRRAHQDAARCDPVAVAAPLRRSHHPRAVSAENQIAHLVHGLGLHQRGDLRAGGWSASLADMPDLEVIDSELRLVAATQGMPGGRQAHADDQLCERIA